MNRHLSAGEISLWISGERTEEQQRHLLACAHCKAEVDAVDQTFALFRESATRWSDHWQVEPAVARPRLLPRIALMAAAMAACAALSLVWLRPAAAPHSAAQPAEAPFVEMPYVAPLAPYERAEVVRMDVPVAALEAAGLELHVPDTGATVLADVLLGQDGRAHAIRLVSNREASKRRVSQ